MRFDAAHQRAADTLQNISSWIHDFVLRLKTSTQFTESNAYAELNSREKRPHREAGIVQWYEGSKRRWIVPL